MNINEKLQSVMKGMTKADLGQSVLVPEQAKQFLQVMADASPVLDAARRIVMNSHTRNIDRISFGGSLVKATEGVAPADASAPVTKTNQLVVEEYVMIENLTDTAIEDSIDQLDKVVVNLMGNKTGYDLEVFGLAKWLGHAGVNAYDATANPTDVEKIMNGMIAALPAKFDRNRKALKFFVSRDFEDKYRDVLRARGTTLGDSAQVSATGVAFKGIELVVVPAMGADKALLVDPNNLVYGVYRDIRIEDERNAKARSTDFVLSLRADFNYENEEAAVVASNIAL